MANEIVEKEQTFSAALTDRLTKNAEIIPKDLNIPRFVTNVVSVLNEHPDYAKYGKEAILSNAMKGAIYGLDFMMKECYMVPYGNQLQFLTGYKGACKLAKKYAVRPVNEINAWVVREGDLLDVEIRDDNQKFKFQPKPFSNAPIIGAFGAVFYKDGKTEITMINKEGLDAARNQSKAQNSPAWKNFTDEMYKKVVLNRMCKTITMDFENAFQHEAFTEGISIETDRKELVKNEVERSANTEDFVED